MAWVNIPEIVPIGLSFTHGTVINMVQKQLMARSSEVFENAELRLYVNMALAHYVRNSNDERFMETWTFTVAKVVGTQYYEHDLREPWAQTSALSYSHRYPKTHQNLNADEFIPYNAITRIVSILPIWDQNESPVNKMHGSAREMNLENFDGLVNGSNTAYRHSVAWTLTGPKLLLYYGQNTNVAGQSPQYEVPTNWQMRVIRMPILDDLTSEYDQGTNPVMNRIIDCPDDAIGTIVQHAAGLALASRQPNSDRSVERADARVQAAQARELTEPQAEIAGTEAQRLGFPSR